MRVNVVHMNTSTQQTRMYRRHKCRVPMISLAGVRSPVQLMRRGPAEETNLVAERSIQTLHPIGGLIHQDHRPVVRGEQAGGSLLIAPGEAAARIVRELHVVGRIRVDEVPGPERQRFDVAARKRPPGERSR